MKNKFAVLVSALLLFVVGEVSAQDRVSLPIVGWQYPNALSTGGFKNPWYSSTGDTLTNTTNDSLTIGVLYGKLSPIAITLTVEATEITGTADSVDVIIQTGNGGFFVTASPTFRFGGATSTTVSAFGTRTLVFNNTGAPPTTLSTLSSTMTIPHCDALRLLVANKSGTTATTRWRVRAFGIYERN